MTFIAARYARSRSVTIACGPPWRFIALQEFQRCLAIPPFRSKNLKHFAFMVDCAPNIVSLAIDPYEHLVQVPAPV